MAEDKAPTGNADYSWSQFDSEYYFQHYYGDPHPDDDLVIKLAVEYFKNAVKPGDAPLDVVDVGTGPNLIPFFAVLPVAAKLTAWEYAESNVDWLKADLQKDEMRPQWTHFWKVAQDAYGDRETPANPIPELRKKADVLQGSIFDLPNAKWTAATMFFCAESITSKFEEFEQGVAAFARCVKPGGHLAAAFLVRSSGSYQIGDTAFPVLNVTAEEIQEAFERYATNVKGQRIGLHDREIREGYSGFIFLTGRAAG